MYVKLRSWHIIRTWVTAGQGLTLCGRGFTNAHCIADGFGEEKSCESCLRIAAK